MGEYFRVSMGMAQRLISALLDVLTTWGGRREHRFSIEAEKDWYCSYEALEPVLSRRAAPVAQAILPERRSCWLPSHVFAGPCLLCGAREAHACLPRPACVKPSSSVHCWRLCWLKLLCGILATDFGLGSGLCIQSCFASQALPAKRCMRARAALRLREQPAGLPARGGRIRRGNKYGRSGQRRRRHARALP